MRTLRRTTLSIAALAALSVLSACKIGQPDPDYWVARPISSEARYWQIYHRGAWRDVNVDGLRPPNTLKPHVLNAPNWFIFAGQTDTLALMSHGTQLPKFELEAWNILWPLWRRYEPGGEIDTTGQVFPTEDDFVDLVTYQRFAVNTSSQWWPLLGSLQVPEDDARERGYRLRIDIWYDEGYGDDMDLE
mgnify:CR=1 FL=1